ncbi:PKD domain-containing protein, partial [Robiginitalea sp.]|uniref:PKD domain-containing protein n=1 Tax=Robiginitalea sp. TaxID=1902411 RepID=UPI003C7306E9
MKNILSIGRRFSIWMVLLAFLGCSDDDFDRLPQVVSSFTYTVNEDTGTVTFVNVSEGARTYVWDFGDGTTSKEIDPIKTYSDSGTFTVSLVASNQAGASSTFEDELTLNIKKGITLPITFDDANVIYEASTFEGAAFEIVANPDVSGSNDKETNVGQITNSGAAFEGLFFDLETPIDLTTEKSITMNFWSEVPVDVLMKLEEGTGAATETTASHGGTGWEEIAFDFTSSEAYTRLTLFVDGAGTTAGTFYIDDIAQTGEDSGGGDNPLVACEGGELVNDFESADDSIFSNFGGGVGTVIDNPDTSVNPSAKVGQYVKNAGEVFAGITIEVDPDIDFNAGVFSIDVNSQAVRQLLFKLEGLGIEQVIPTSGTGWETITYDFSSAAGNVGA